MSRVYALAEETSESIARARVAAAVERQEVLNRLYHDAVDGADYSLAQVIELTREFGVEHMTRNLKLVAALHGCSL